jgi:hypothetical protein
MADQKEVQVRARMLASAAQLGGKHLKQSNQELYELQHQYTVAEYNALLLAIRCCNEADRADNPHLPRLIFGFTHGGVVPDHIVPHFDRKVSYCSPEAEVQVRERIKEIGNSQSLTGLPGTATANPGYRVSR